MNLVIDRGNTRLKAAVFEGDELAAHEVFGQNPNPEALISAFERYGVSRAMIADVGEGNGQLKTELERVYDGVFSLSHDTPLPFELDYKTPETLGIDRIALAAGGQLYGESVMVIDAGTCLTYEVLTDNTYRGGAITPGIKMRLRAMHEFTGGLPLFDEVTPTEFPGRSTKECMMQGGINSVLHEINGFIDAFERQYNGGKVILTGGDGIYLAGALKNRTFADTFLLLKGLNQILNYQD